MSLSKYRIKEFDLMNDIWILQRRVLFVFWISAGVGPKVQVEKKCNELNQCTPADHAGVENQK